MDAKIEPVAWRWKFKDHKLWAYCDNYPVYAASGYPGQLDIEPLYIVPSGSVNLGTENEG